MNQASVSWFAGTNNHSFLRCLSVLVSSIGVALLLVLPVAIWLQGTQGAWDALAACSLCLIPSIGALAVGYRYLGTPNALSAILAGMGFRAVPPLVVCMVLALQRSASESIHLVSYLLVFYMVALATETMLSVGLVKQKQLHRSDL